ncbi:MAG: DUF488 family protein [Rubrobacteraceae bacterium]
MDGSGEEHIEVFTIGHSNHSLEEFLGLLKEHGIEALVDVRSHPRSRYAPHFNKDVLKKAVDDRSVKYLFLGRELGGRPEGDEFYDEDGRVDYGRVAQSETFKEGVRRVKDGAGRFRVALMCSEEDPTGCHRELLVGRVLREEGVDVRHIRGEGNIQSEEDLEEDQLALFEEPREREEWKSVKPIRSASPGRPPRSSSGR